jgi:hypothetical protein
LQLGHKPVLNSRAGAAVEYFNTVMNVLISISSEIRDWHIVIFFKMTLQHGSSYLVVIWLWTSVLLKEEETRMMYSETYRFV